MKVGVWIDHRHAILVELRGEKESTQTIESGLEKHVRLAGGSRSATPWGPQDIASEPARERKWERHLNEYYDRVAEALRDAEEIFLCGPGEAKGELKKRMELSGRAEERIVATETVDKMTEAQLRAKVRSVFAE
jgi:hypothetical protein